MHVRLLGMIVLSFVIFGMAVSCLASQDDSYRARVDSYHNAFWMHTETGHAKDYYIQISLPRSYFETDTTAYPVLYLTDADFCFNMARDLTIVLDWPQREVIIVGIGYGSPERMMELRWPEYGDTPDEKGIPGQEQLLAFIEKTLMPRVESEYRVDCHNRTLFGWSWGVMFVTYVLEDRAELFQNYILGGGYRDLDYVNALYAKRPDLPVALYLGIGDRDGRKDQFRQFGQAMENMGFGGMQLRMEIFPEFEHEIVTVGVLLDRGMKWIYGRKPIEPRLRLAMKTEGIGEAIQEYRRLLKTNPEDFDFNPHHLIAFAESLRNDGQIDAHDVIMSFVDEEYPERLVTIRVIPKILPESDIVYITGNCQELGNWNPKGVVMQQSDTAVWEHIFPIRSARNLEFKITRGSWDTEAADSTGRKLSNFEEHVNSDTTITKVIARWIDTE